MEASVQHWRLSETEKASNMSLLEDLRDARASAQLVSNNRMSVGLWLNCIHIVQ